MLDKGRNVLFFSLPHVFSGLLNSSHTYHVPLSPRPSSLRFIDAETLYTATSFSGVFPECMLLKVSFSHILTYAFLTLFLSPFPVLDSISLPGFLHCSPHVFVLSQRSSTALANESVFLDIQLQPAKRFSPHPLPDEGGNE